MLTQLWRLASARFGRRLVGWTFAHMSFALPIHRLRETDMLLALRHPNPSYPFHVLLVSRRAVQTLSDLDATDAAFLHDLFSTVQSLVQEFHLVEGGYRLILNGGEFQELPQLHFHLVSILQTSNA